MPPQGFIKADRQVFCLQSCKKLLVHKQTSQTAQIEFARAAAPITPASLVSTQARIAGILPVVMFLVSSSTYLRMGASRVSPDWKHRRQCRWLPAQRYSPRWKCRRQHIRSIIHNSLGGCIAGFHRVKGDLGVHMVNIPASFHIMLSGCRVIASRASSDRAREEA